ncbi:hypothetical protein J6590_057308 [Homalodisca vitripennis]|nr:hypothetical protein J6590_057308 [Homalodisca vitripennis]
MAGQAGRLQGQDRSAVTYPSSSHARRCLIWLSCDNRRTRYTAPFNGRLKIKDDAQNDLRCSKCTCSGVFSSSFGPVQNLQVSA